MDNDETFPEMGDEVVELQSPDPADLSAQVKFWQDRAKKAEKQAVDRKVALGRFETASKHGISAELIPDWVPLDKMDEFAEKFAKAASAAPVQTETGGAVEPETGPTEAEQNLAAVVREPVPSGGPPQYSPQEALEKAKQDPAWLAAELAAGRNPLPPLNIGRDRVQTDWEP